MSIEQLLFLLLFVLVPLLNLIVRWLRRRAQARQRQAGGERREVPEGTRTPQPPRDVPARTPPPRQPPPRVRVVERLPALEELPRPARPRTVAAPPPGRRRHGRLRLGGRRELRRAIVLMAVLGPCRGHEGPSAAGAPGPAPGAGPERGGARPSP